MATFEGDKLLQDKHIQKYREAEKVLIEQQASHVIFAHNIYGKIRNITYHKPLAVSRSRLAKIQKRIGTKCLLHVVHAEEIKDEH